ncbi:MAG: methyltransferase [Bacteroidota bacterium]|nr:methyltransferase [Bacteroidota bacterium]
MKTYTFLFIIFIPQLCFSQAKKLIFHDDFSKPLDTSIWKIEISNKQGDSVYTNNGKLILDTYNGVTVWLRKELKGNVQIEYKRKVMMEGKKNDRLSDLNQFWMANDLHNNNLFTRKGGFKEYDSLSMYYVGMGGNYNSTTRFRKYDGKGGKQIIAEYKDSLHLLQPNTEYNIQICMNNGEITFTVNGTVYFQYTDNTPLTQGYFAIRSTRSRQEIEEINIYQSE